MKKLATLCILAAMTAMPFTVAQAGEHMMNGEQTGKMAVQHGNCPMTGDMQKMHDEMSEMKAEMGGMMKMMSDPDMKERMQKMHEHMSGMMQHMEKMHAGMGGGMMKDGGIMQQHGMMGGGEMQDSQYQSTPDNDHESHH